MLRIVADDAPLAVYVVDSRDGDGYVEAQGCILGDVLEYPANLEAESRILLDEEDLPHGLVYASELLSHGPGYQGSVPFAEDYGRVRAGEDRTGKYPEIVGVYGDDAVFGDQFLAVFSVYVTHR